MNQHFNYYSLREMYLYIGKVIFHTGKPNYWKY